jgi:hypothetical protein
VILGGLSFLSTMTSSVWGAWSDDVTDIALGAHRPQGLHYKNENNNSNIPLYTHLHIFLADEIASAEVKCGGDWLTQNGSIRM